MEDVKILRVELKGKKYLVYSSVDDDPVKVTEDTIVNHKLFKGTVLSSELWDKIKNGNDESLLFDKALNHIDYKPRTTKEIKDFLKKKEATVDVIERIIERLISIRYLNDEKYTERFIEEGIRNKKGPVILFHQLEDLGIDRIMINQYLDNYTKEIEYDNALDIATKYYKTVLKHPAKKQRELIYNKLIRSGYNYDISSKVINMIEYTTDDLEELNTLYNKLKEKTDDKNKIITSLISKGYKYEDIKKIMNE